ncbi:hypothetical protein FRC04_007119 [Tulasnella sp. 424]|nr:hypothetical protein FRC04_007119 [Tulasnella sp. 424]KAG8960075.1 hypothetical protein FRC05_007126 [Tulasnella sp. 425]
MYSSEIGISELDSDDFYGPDHRLTLDCVKLVLDYMDSIGMSLATFVDALFYGDPECTTDHACCRRRSVFFSAISLPKVLSRMMRFATQNGPKEDLQAWSLWFVQDALEDKMTRTVRHLKVGDLSVDRVLSLDFGKLRDWMENQKTGCHTLWTILFQLSMPPKGRTNNTMKNPKAMIISVICQLAFSRSNRANYLQQAFSLFFKADGLSSKANMLLNHLGITLSNTWQNEAVDTLSEEAMTTIRGSLSKQAVFLSADNVNIPFHVFGQRIHNKSSFESGTAATVFPMEGVPPLDGPLFCKAAWVAWNLEYSDLVDIDAGHRIHVQKVYHLLQFLLNLPYFKHYPHHDNPLLKPPPPV